jgi:hypothetical protein
LHFRPKFLQKQVPIQAPICTSEMTTLCANCSQHDSQADRQIHPNSIKSRSGPQGVRLGVSGHSWMTKMMSLVTKMDPPALPAGKFGRSKSCFAALYQSCQSCQSCQEQATSNQPANTCCQKGGGGRGEALKSAARLARGLPLGV